MKEAESARITTIADNDVWKEGLASTWGLSFHIETFWNNKKYTFLMDTSGSFQTFFNNTSKLGLNLSAIEAVFVSHWHGDHCGALNQVLSMLNHPVRVYVPPGNSFGIRKIREAGGFPVICREPVQFIDGVMSTGVVPGRLSEHALLINVKKKGLAVLTGCSHPGLFNILECALKVSGVEKIHAVIGGFHISTLNEGLKTGGFLLDLNVKIVSPCHCTSNEARRGIAKIMKEKYVKNGSGKVIVIG